MSGSSDELLRHGAFLQRVCRRLVDDPDRAADARQETWLRVLGRRREPRAGALRPWLAAVARNTVIGTWASESSRASRERAAARPDQVAGPAEIAERLALQRSVVDAIEALGEPYRSVVFLRYYDDLSPPAIADRLGLPLNTVKTRLRRALGLLRSRLDREWRGRERWLAALTATVGPVDVLPLAPLGAQSLALWMQSKLKLSLAALVLVLAGWGLVARFGPPSRSSAELAAGGARDAELVGAAAQPSHADLAAPDPHAPRRPEDPAAATGETAAPAGVGGPPTVDPPGIATPPAVLVGRVYHREGPPAAEAYVWLGPMRARADLDGRFALELGRPLRGAGGFALDPATALVAVKPGYAAAVRPRFAGVALGFAERGEEVELVLPAETGSIAGFVLEVDGSPATDWWVRALDGTVVAEGADLPLSAEDLAAAPEDPPPLSNPGFSSRGANGGPPGYHGTHADGSFELRGLTVGKSYRVRAWNPRTLQSIESPPLPTGTTDARLQARDDRVPVDGVVVGTDGQPLAGVRCFAQGVLHRNGERVWTQTGPWVRSDASGRFAFGLLAPSDVLLEFRGYGGEASLALELETQKHDLRVVLNRPGTFRTIVPELEPAPDRLAVEDGEGQRLLLRLNPGPNASRLMRSVAVEAGQELRIAVLESARWLVYLSGDEELQRLPLVVKPDPIPEADR